MSSTTGYGGNILLDEESLSLPPSYEFTIEQTVSSSAAFRPPSLNQLALTANEARKILLTANIFWNQRNWAASRARYTTAAALFRIIQDARNEALSLQRLGEICRIMHDFVAAKAHIWQAHVLFGRCGEGARQLMCERSLARVASDEGMKGEARTLLQTALNGSRTAGLRESEGWCLLRLGELDGMNKSLIQQALDIARQEKISLLENCISAMLNKDERSEGITAPGPSRHKSGGKVARTNSDTVAGATMKEVGRRARSKSLNLPAKYFRSWFSRAR